MPSLLIYVQQECKLPQHLTFSLAALMSLYHGGKLADGKLTCSRGGETYTLQDDAAVLSFFAEKSSLPVRDMVEAFLGNEAFFGNELIQVPGIVDSVADSLADILANGMTAVVTKRFGG